MIGIYFIYSKSQNQYYIGKSIDIQKRFWKHLSDLHLGKHHSPYLQFVFNKYGEDDLIFSIVEECSVKDNLGQLEKDYIIKYNSYETGFNCTLGGDGGTLGRKFS